MKQDTFVLVTKAICYVGIGAGTPLGTALAQWANSGNWPDRINWTSMLIGAAVGGCTQLLSFLSNTYSDYTQARTNGNGNTLQPTNGGTAQPNQTAEPKATKP